MHHICGWVCVCNVILSALSSFAVTTLVAVLLLCGYLCSVNLPHGAWIDLYYFDSWHFILVFL